MPCPMLNIEFEDKGQFNMVFAPHKPVEYVPEWTKFKNFPCPGNIEHGPLISYCRLGAEIDKLVAYFATISSIDNGCLTLKHGHCMEIKIRCDAQTIFYNAIWIILLHSNCSVFKFNQWARSNYRLTIEPERLFYALYSIFIVENTVVHPNKEPDLKKFKAELNLLRSVVNNLLERLRIEAQLKSDAVSNGLVLLGNLIYILDMDFELFYDTLKNRIKTDSVLEKWAANSDNLENTLGNRLLHYEELGEFAPT